MFDMFVEVGGVHKSVGILDMSFEVDRRFGDMSGQVVCWVDINFGRLIVVVTWLQMNDYIFQIY